MKQTHQAATWGDEWWGDDREEEWWGDDSWSSWGYDEADLDLRVCGVPNGAQLPQEATIIAGVNIVVHMCCL